MLNKLATTSCNKILLIDDDGGVLKALSMLFKVMGFDVTALDNPLKAVEQIQDEGNQYHLIVSDLRMPGLDGIEVLKKTKLLRPQVPFLLISGHATSDEVSLARSLGAEGFIGKPFNPVDFEHVFKELFEI